MGNLVFLDDAPADIGTAGEMYRFPIASPPYGQTIGEFTRSEVEPDVDVYDTRTLLKNTEVFVALFPSFLFFDEMLDSGNVTIEVLDDTGSVVPSTPVALSSSAVALTMVKFTTGPDDANYFYRLTPESGLVHGEYLLADNAPEGSGGPPPFAREGGGRRLQNGLDGDTIPFQLNLFDLFSTAAKAERYTDFDIGGSPFSTTGRTIRLGLVAGGSAVDFKVTSNSTHPVVQRVMIDDGGIITGTTNLTLADGNVDFQLSTTEAAISFMVLKFDSPVDVQIEAQYAGDEASIVTHSCILKVNCPASSIDIPRLEANDLVAVDITMMGNLNSNSRAIPFVDRNTGVAYGSFRTTASCPSNFVASGVIIAPTTSSGSVELDIAPPSALQGCNPELGIKAIPISLNEYLGIDDVLKNFSSSARSTCSNENCTSGSFEFSATNGFAATSNLTMLIQGFAGSRLTLSMDNDVFYNESFEESCTDDPAVLQNLALPSLSSTQESLSIHYALEGSTVCTDRQNLVLGVMGFTESTAAPSGAPPTGGVVDDLPLVAGLSTAAVFVVLGSLLFLFYRSSVRAVGGETAVVVKEKSEV